MEGDLAEFSLPDILQFVSLGSRSGTLEVVVPARSHRITFAGGVITALAADGWSFAAELLANEVEPSPTLAAALATGSAAGVRSAVLTGGVMTAEEWTALVARQVERLLYPLFDAKSGRFRFQPAVEPQSPSFPVRLTTDRAVLEGTRWSEAWARALTMLPTREQRLGRHPGPPRRSMSIGANQWRVYAGLATAASVAEVAARMALTEVEVVEALPLLLEQGLIRPTDADA